MKKRLIALVMVLALVVGGAVAGTVAWLTDNTVTVENTFTIGDINIDLTETDTTDNKKNYDYVPGDEWGKDPTVIVKAGSEDAFVFVKVVVANNEIEGIDVIDWAIAEGWNPYTNTTESNIPGNGIYYFYRTYTGGAKAEYPVLAGNVVNVNTEITKDMVSTLKQNKPTLSFTAAAVQVKNIETVDKAWNALPAEFTGATSNPYN